MFEECSALVYSASFENGWEKHTKFIKLNTTHVWQPRNVHCNFSIKLHWFWNSEYQKCECSQACVSSPQRGGKCFPCEDLIYIKYSEWNCVCFCSNAGCIRNLVSKNCIYSKFTTIFTLVVCQLYSDIIIGHILYMGIWVLGKSSLTPRN